MMRRKRFVLWVVVALAAAVGRVEAAASKGPILLAGGIPLKVITVKDTKAREEAREDAKGIPLSVFTILYVLPTSSETADRRLDAIGADNRKQKGWFRVAYAPHERDYCGWVHERDVVEWTHREAVQFMPQLGRPRATFFRTEDAARKAFQGRPEPGSDVAREPATVGRHHVLMPILESSRLTVSGHDVPVHKVAFMASLGPGAPPPVRTSGGDVVDEQFVRDKSTADIVFVIDTTRSMAPPIEQVKASVRKVAEALRKETDGELAVSLRLGLVAYRDDDAESRADGGYLTKVFCTLAEGKEPGAFEKRLATVGVAGGGRLAEDVLAGLSDAMGPEVGWNEVGWKQIILVGDASAKERDHPDDASKANRDSMTLDDLKRKAQPDLASRAESLMKLFTIHAIHVWNPHAHYSQDNAVADRQFRSLSKGARRADAKGFFASMKGGDSPEDFSQDLSEYLLRSLRNFVDQVKRGKPPPAPAAPPPPTGPAPPDPRGGDGMGGAAATPYVILELIRALPGAEGAAKLPGFHEGWATELDARGHTVLTPHVLVIRQDLEQFANGFNYLLGELESYRESGRSLEELLGSLKMLTAGATTGERLGADTSLDRVFGGFLGVPLQSKVFEMTLRKLTQMSDGGYSDWLRRAKDSARQIQGLLARPDAWFHLLASPGGVAPRDNLKHAFLPLSDLP
jgi:hypothetical protein